MDEKKRTICKEKKRLSCRKGRGKKFDSESYWDAKKKKKKPTSPMKGGPRSSTKKKTCGKVIRKGRIPDKDTFERRPTPASKDPVEGASRGLEGEAFFEKGGGALSSFAGKFR